MPKDNPIVQVGNFLLQVRGKRVLIKDDEMGDEEGYRFGDAEFDFNSCETQAIFNKRQAQQVLHLLDSLQLGPYKLTNITPEGLDVGCTHVSRELAEEVNKLL